MRNAIQQYIERNEARASFRAEALESWKAFRETGLHLKGDEVRDWLGTWGSDETNVPDCHN